MHGMKTYIWEKSEIHDQSVEIILGNLKMQLLQQKFEWYQQFLLILQVAGDFLICENEIQTKSEQFYHIYFHKKKIKHFLEIF